QEVVDDRAERDELRRVDQPELDAYLLPRRLLERLPHRSARRAGHNGARQDDDVEVVLVPKGGADVFASGEDVAERERPVVIARPRPDHERPLRVGDGNARLSGRGQSIAASVDHLLELWLEDWGASVVDGVYEVLVEVDADDLESLCRKTSGHGRAELPE